jgi:hypothetical protein
MEGGKKNIGKRGGERRDGDERNLEENAVDRTGCWGKMEGTQRNINWIGRPRIQIGRKWKAATNGIWKGAKDSNLEVHNT